MSEIIKYRDFEIEPFGQEFVFSKGAVQYGSRPTIGKCKMAINDWHDERRWSLVWDIQYWAGKAFKYAFYVVGIIACAGLFWFQFIR